MSTRRYGNKYLADPAWDAVAITPSATELVDPTRAVYVGGVGDLAVTMASGNDVTFTAVPAGTTLAIRCSHILSTGTTATSIVGLI